MRYLALIVLLLVSGCAPLGAAAYKLGGPPAVPARYVPAQERLLVLVENFRQPSAAYVDSELLAQHIHQKLKDRGVVPLVDLDRLRELRTQHPQEVSRMSIAAIGRAVGARQVLYVDLMRHEVHQIAGTEVIQGHAVARVKIVDAETGETRWPTDLSDGEQVGYATQMGVAQRHRPEMALREHMSLVLGDRIAKLFYKWKPEDMAEVASP